MCPVKAHNKRKFNPRCQEELVMQNARTVVRQRGGDPSDATQVSGDYILQFGKYKGKSFRRLLENDIGPTPSPSSGTSNGRKLQECSWQRGTTRTASCLLTQLPQNILQGQLRQGVVPGLPAAFQSSPAPRVIQLRVLTLHWWAAL
ncbi:hypothetical protein EYF80_023271 [Liparis tanakae]|uniref:Uncharacterized protein n=1 Tax=Liparis tanakae TaxID=230148 RepID=A0A4Z2HKW0_9TELE|nr:hypothetical protein EYF80_023271 [Liparis tanakae]